MAKRGLAIVFTLLAIAVAISIVGMVTLYFAFGRAPSIPANSMLVVDIGGDLPESASNDVVAYLRGSRTPTVRSLVEMLHSAKVDDRVAALVLKPTGLSTSFWAKVQELRGAVLDFKQSGKPVYAFLPYSDEQIYYLATAADHIFLTPSAPLDLKGIATYQVFLRGTFDKIGVVPDMHHIGDYKTTINAYTEKGYTAAHREMDESINRDLFEQMAEAIAEARRLSVDDVRALIDQGPFLADAALQARLIDEVAYEDQALEKVRTANGRSLRLLKGQDYARVSPRPSGRGSGPRIAVIYASGPIVDGRGGFDPLNGPSLGSETLIEAIRSAADDEAVRAFVLRIDSPGGSATASDAIWRELTVAREKTRRPLVASMADLAASGGYYIAMPAETIVAQPSTLTGSIGIFGGKLVTGGVFEKLGAHIDSTSIGRNAEMFSPTRPFNESELQKVEEQLRAFYTEFVRKVSQSRNTTPDRIDAVAQGRVWTGRQAKANGLVDELGGLDTAIALAKARANIPEDADVDIVTYPRPKTLYEVVTEGIPGATDSAVQAALNGMLSDDERAMLRALRGGGTMFRRGEVLALMPGGDWGR